LRSLVVVEIGDLDPRLLEQLARRAARQFSLQVVPERPRLDPSFAYDEDRGQFLATALLERLGRLGGSCFRVLGVAAADLFNPVLTFVFGEAEMPGRAAVFSIYRLREEFYGLPARPDLLLERAAKETLHELGHTFGLPHCADHACVMSSSHSVEAVDRRGDSLCRACLARLGRLP
jgi:archaemetzincin